MTENLATVDAEGGFRDWLRTQATLAGARVFVDVKGAPTLPYLTVGIVTISEDTSNAPLDSVTMQFDCWGSDKRSAQALYGQVRASLRALAPGTTLRAGTTVRGTPVVGPGTGYFPDEDGTHRYVISAQVLVGP